MEQSYAFRNVYLELLQWPIKSDAKISTFRFFSIFTMTHTQRLGFTTKTISSKKPTVEYNENTPLRIGTYNNILRASSV